MLLAKLVISLGIFCLIEVIDTSADSFSLPYWLSAAIALVIVFGGFLIFVDSNGDVDFW